MVVMTVGIKFVFKFIHSLAGLSAKIRFISKKIGGGDFYGRIVVTDKSMYLWLILKGRPLIDRLEYSVSNFPSQVFRLAVKPGELEPT